MEEALNDYIDTQNREFNTIKEEVPFTTPFPKFLLPTRFPSPIPQPQKNFPPIKFFRFSGLSDISKTTDQGVRPG
jgi:hypothetical protein